MVVFTCTFHYGWLTVWNALGIHSIAPPFLDARGLAASVETLRHGGDPSADNPFDQLHRPFNYPRIWLSAASLLHLDEHNIWIAGVAFCVLYLVCVSKLILGSRSAWEGFALLIAALSIAPLFAVERGSTDLLVFSLVFLGCVLPNAPQRAGLFFLATLLKLFPLAALMAEGIQQRGRKRAWPATLLGVVGVLLVLQWRDLLLIQRGTPVAGNASYGLLSLREGLWFFLVAHHLLGRSAYYVAVGVTIACLIAGLLIAAQSWRRPGGVERDLPASGAGSMFFIFGSIYFSSFVIASNWDYRLIFLLPTLPFAFEAVREPARAKWAVAYIVSVLCTENVVAFEGGYKVLLAQAFTIATFLLIVPVLLEQLKSRLFPEKMAGPVATTECA